MSERVGDLETDLKALEERLDARGVYVEKIASAHNDLVERVAAIESECETEGGVDKRLDAHEAILQRYDDRLTADRRAVPASEIQRQIDEAAKYQHKGVVSSIEQVPAEFHRGGLEGAPAPGCVACAAKDERIAELEEELVKVRGRK